MCIDGYSFLRSIAIFRTGRDYIYVRLHIYKKNIKRLINHLIY